MRYNGKVYLDGDLRPDLEEEILREVLGEEGYQAFKTGKSRCKTGSPSKVHPCDNKKKKEDG